MAQVEGALPRGRGARAAGGVRLHEPDAGAAAREDRHQHGRRRRRSRTRRSSTNAMAELAKISGQKPVVTKARKSVANFKLREGMPIGCKVTLAPAAHVRVPRPAGQHRPAARPRLPRRVAQELRRPRQLRARASRSRSSSPRSATTRSRRSRGMDIIICTTAKTDDGGQGASRRLRHAVQEVTGRRSDMAKKSAVEKNNRRRKDGGALRREAAALKKVVMDRAPRAGGAVRGDPQAGGDAAQRREGADPQPLHADRAAARPTTGSSVCRASRCAIWPREGQIPGVVKASW